MAERIVFHYNKAHNTDKTIPPWIVKSKGETFYVDHFESEVGFSTKETPENAHTKGSLLLRGILTILPGDKNCGGVNAKVTK